MTKAKSILDMTKDDKDDLLAIPDFLKRDLTGVTIEYDNGNKDIYEREEDTRDNYKWRSMKEIHADVEKERKAKAEAEKAFKETKKAVPKISIQQRMRNQVSELAGELEYEIDQFVENKCQSKFKMYKWITNNDVKGPQAGMIADIYKPQLAELEETKSGTCPQLNESYQFLSKGELNRYIEFLKGWIDDANRWSANRKTDRKPRKLKKRSVEQTIKHLKFKEEDFDFKVASVEPGLIIGASELWVLHTGFVKKIAVYRAIDRGGLQVHRSSIRNYDVNNSVEKRIGKNPDETIKKILEGGKVTLRNLTSTLRAKDEEATGRLNQNTILLRVIK